VREGARKALGIPEDEAMDFPVSVKTRLAEAGGKFDLDKTVHFLRAVSDAGASWITVHTRLPSHGFKQKATSQRENFMQAVKGLQDAGGKSIPPIFINGEIVSGDSLRDVLAMADKAGVSLHGVMIGQAISSGRNYDLLRQALRRFPREGSAATPDDPALLTDAQRIEMARRFLRFMAERLGISFFRNERIIPSVKAVLPKGAKGRKLESADQKFFDMMMTGLSALSELEVVRVLREYTLKSGAGRNRTPDSHGGEQR